MRTITKRLVLEIKENVECPELGFTHYGKWGSSSREQRLTTNALCDDWLWRYDLLDDLENRIKEAIEYIKHSWWLRTDQTYDTSKDLKGWEVEELLSILERGKE